MKKSYSVLLDNALRNLWHGQPLTAVHTALSASAKLATKLPRYRSKKSVAGYQWIH